MEFGVSTACMYPVELEQVIEAYGKLGIRQIEIFINTFSELSKDYIGELKTRTDFYGMKVCSVHPFTSGLEPMMFFSDYERRVADMLELYKRYFEAMEQLEASIFVFHGDFRTSSHGAAFYAERYSSLLDCAEQYRFTVAQENIGRCKSGDLRFLSELKELLGKRLSFVFDVKQAIRSEVSPKEVLDIMGNQVVHLHLNDHTAAHDCLLPGAGEFDFEGCLRQIYAAGAEPSAVIEVYRGDYGGENELVESLKYLNKLCLM